MINSHYYSSFCLLNKCHCFGFQRGKVHGLWQMIVTRCPCCYMPTPTPTIPNAHKRERRSSRVNNAESRIHHRTTSIYTRAHTHQSNHLPIKWILNILNFVSCSEINKTIPFVCIFKCNPSSLVVSYVCPLFNSVVLLCLYPCSAPVFFFFHSVPIIFATVYLFIGCIIWNDAFKYNIVC